ncbi:ribonucleoside-diphosphate reductase class II [Marinitoga hydrogenitolerans DSM 16785]|uniref:Ribonucleoside-diphosphate reductase n=1 Tax=Marinitoga hydrogenitolerans (strain DSM 16785 / JCM 12826 / AT1271) TaxID=1122195 RepID=A0A1M4ZMU8_MARH1|nr:LAGLIDADG family homing endonuclease [Marinitoga hydrogenitolerans]SHF19255.1 ribonucleoside-diphosphate reductase class II [Marinitoga hydrogenitolerans DSM 16785]
MEDILSDFESLLDSFTDIKPSENAERILRDRYLLKDGNGNYLEHNWSDISRRVSRYIASAEVLYTDDIDKIRKVEKIYYKLLKSRIFLPNSPTLFNAGKTLSQDIFKKDIKEMLLDDYKNIYNSRNRHNMLSACFVVPLEDSMEGIFNAVKDAALIQKYGGGVGYDFSILRPKDSSIAGTGGKSSGPISFMHVFNTTASTIEQGGARRGAQMAVMRYDHPDVIDFINSKKDNDGKSVLNYFNISINFDNPEKFLKKLENDEELELSHSNSNIKKTIKARELFDLIANNAWKSGDPGMLFLGRHNKYYALGDVTPVSATNPCVVGDTLVLTNKGLIKAKELTTDMKVWSPISNQFLPIEKIIDQGVKPIKSIKLKNGIELKATYDHKVYTENGWKKIEDLKIGEKIRVISDEISFEDAEEHFEYENIIYGKNNHHINQINISNSVYVSKILGLFIGDGSLGKDGRISFSISKNDKTVDEIKNLIEEISDSTITEIEEKNQVKLLIRSKNLELFIRNITDIELGSPSDSETKKIPDKILTNNKIIQKEFLKGLFTADGSVYNSKGSITISLSSISKKLLEDTQIILLNFGIFSTLTKEKEERTAIIKGKKIYRLLISGKNSYNFYKNIGFMGEKQKKLKFLVENHLEKKGFYNKNKSFIEIVKITDFGQERVYDITAGPDYVWVTNGILSYDCGEEPLPPYGSCNLGSIDLAKIIDYIDLGNPNDEKKDIFKEIIYWTSRFLDNVIDINIYPLKEIEKVSKEQRFIGLGIMGIADSLYKKNIPYNSNEGRNFMAETLAQFAYYSHLASTELAKERGNFPLFDKSKYKDGFIPFPMLDNNYSENIKIWNSLIKEHFYGEAKKYKRNVQVNTVAPTGSISNIADTSSGIEPNFMLAYIRYMTDKEGNRVPLPYMNKILRDKLDGLLNSELEAEIIEKGSIQHIENISEDFKKVFVTAMDISGEDHLLAQHVIQSYLDASCSKTINLPKETTVEDIKNIYIKAMKLNLKGITIYRDGSLETQVLTNSKKDDKKVTFFVLDEKHKLRARPRKETLKSVTRKFKTDSGTVYITVSFDDNGEAIEIFLSDGTETAEIIGRLSSIALRTGVSVDEILEQLSKVKGSYCKGISKEIKSALNDFEELWKDNTDFEVFHVGKPLSKEEVEKFVHANKLEYVKGYYIDNEGNTYCPTCLSKNSLLMTEGCISCKTCGWSKCS